MKTCNYLVIRKNGFKIKKKKLDLYQPCKRWTHVSIKGIKITSMRNTNWIANNQDRKNQFTQTVDKKFLKFKQIVKKEKQKIEFLKIRYWEETNDNTENSLLEGRLFT